MDSNKIKFFWVTLVWKLLVNLYDCVEVVWLVSRTIESDLFFFMIVVMVMMVMTLVRKLMAMMMTMMVVVVGGWMTKGGSATQLNKVCNSANSVNSTQVEESIPSQTIDRAANVEISNRI